MFPLQALKKRNSTATVTYGLILLNVVVFLWELTLSQNELGSAFRNLALDPCQVKNNFFSVETLLDSVRTMFFHGGWLHLIGNMVFLRVFGPPVEDYLGKTRFLIFYLVAGFAAGFAHTLFAPAAQCAVGMPTIPVVGASGAIAGVMGGFLLLYPATRIRTVAFFFRIPVGTVDVQAFYMLVYFFVMDLINGIAALGVKDAVTGGVAVWAHVGGFAVGLSMAFTAMLFRAPPDSDPLEHLEF